MYGKEKIERTKDSNHNRNLKKNKTRILQEVLN